jgi:hypothetical protein
MVSIVFIQKHGMYIRKHGVYIGLVQDLVGQ